MLSQCHQILINNLERFASVTVKWCVSGLRVSMVQGPQLAKKCPSYIIERDVAYETIIHGCALDVP